MNGITGIILAGGTSRRMERHKALLDVGGRPMIAVIAGRLRALTAEVIIAANNTQ